MNDATDGFTVGEKLSIEEVARGGDGLISPCPHFTASFRVISAVYKTPSHPPGIHGTQGTHGRH